MVRYSSKVDHIQVTESLTYARDNTETSYFSDLYRARFLNDGSARARLKKGTKETLVEAEKRGIKFRDVESRALNQSTTSGGDFLPPLYFGELYAEYKRQRRVVAGLVKNFDLPANGLSINVPRVTAGATTAAQTADNANLSTTDETTAVITIPVETIAGYVDLSRQILERAEPGLDEIIAVDLISSYGQVLDNYLINGTGSNGQPKGILQTSYNSIVFTTGSPTVGLLYPKIADATRQVAEAIYERPTAFVMTARRWAWFLATLDANQRPLILPDDGGLPQTMQLKEFFLDSGNAITFNNDEPIRPDGKLLGLPVYIDENMPKTSGSGTNQDIIICACFPKHFLWEDRNGPRIFTFDDLSGSTAGKVRVEAFGFAAFTAERHATATSVVSGTGLTPPTF